MPRSVRTKGYTVLTGRIRSCLQRWYIERKGRDKIRTKHNRGIRKSFRRTQDGAYMLYTLLIVTETSLFHFMQLLLLRNNTVHYGQG